MSATSTRPPEGNREDLGHGKLDFQSNLPLAHAVAIDRELPITVVAGVHAGCYELLPTAASAASPT